MGATARRAAGVAPMGASRHEWRGPGPGIRYPGCTAGPRTPGPGLLDSSSLQGGNETGQHAADVGRSPQEDVPLVGQHVTQPPGDQDLGLELHQGAIRYGELMQIVAEVSATVSFCNVRGKRYRGPPALGDQSVGLALGKGLTGMIDLDDQVHRELPDAQILVSPDRCCVRVRGHHPNVGRVRVTPSPFPCPTKPSNAARGPRAPDTGYRTGGA